MYIFVRVFPVKILNSVTNKIIQHYLAIFWIWGSHGHE
jgi:hypothetical protein